jgi:hypothetical protein
MKQKQKKKRAKTTKNKEIRKMKGKIVFRRRCMLENARSSM